MASGEPCGRAVEIRQSVDIAAPIEVAFAAALEEIGPAGEMPGGQPFPAVVEPWPGGRWYRDLGNGAGHYWGHVQVIKPPALIELCGPMFMSTAAMNHVQYRLTPHGTGTRLALTHTAFGLLPDEFLAGADQGWAYRLNHTRELAERRHAAGR